LSTPFATLFYKFITFLIVSEKFKEPGEEHKAWIAHHKAGKEGSGIKLFVLHTAVWNLLLNDQDHDNKNLSMKREPLKYLIPERIHT
jgi:hypothetical protein